MLSYHLNIVKRQLLDQNGKPMGSIKFKCEKAKNLSLPHNNTLWKNHHSKGKQSSILL